VALLLLLGIIRLHSSVELPKLNVCTWLDFYYTLCAMLLAALLLLHCILQMVLPHEERYDTAVGLTMITGSCWIAYNAVLGWHIYHKGCPPQVPLGPKQTK